MVVLDALTTTFQDLPQIADRIAVQSGQFMNPEQIKDALRRPYREGRIEFLETPEGVQKFRSPGLAGLGWFAQTDITGVFFDDRGEKQKVVAYLNFHRQMFWIKHKTGTLALKRPIPKFIKRLGDAVEWVFQNAEWRIEKC